MITQDTRSPFVDPAAVEAWDAWFRWREHDRLQDITIDSTWQRVAHALTATVPPDERAQAEQDIRQAFRAWEVLLDERVLATAGTGAPDWPNDELAAVVNVASFVRGVSGVPYLDLAGLRRAASLAVILTDLAAWAADADRQRVLRPRIGLIGFGDALVLLRMSYGSVAASRVAAQVAQGLLVGATAGSIKQAMHYGALVHASEGRSAQWLSELPPGLRDVGHNVGLRHATLTAITPQPRLALFANGVADGIDPAIRKPCERRMGAGHSARIISSPGYAQTVLYLHGMTAEWPGLSSEQLELAMRETVDIMQPWIDRPIAHSRLLIEMSDRTTHPCMSPSCDGEFL
ncbi:hypothetical protein [Dyella sp.]|uniref:hypothetical protein n=1 Tax=Dyella sp. TaxID=1869338 RepID=UPI002ED00DA7